MPLPEKTGDWTWDDLQDLPDHYRYEIVDGALVVNALPFTLHDFVAAELGRRLAVVAPHELVVLGPAGVGMGRTFRGPDVVVARREAVRARPKFLLGQDVLLVVEVLSASSRTTDRVTKRFEYPAAGIPSYWLVDPEAPSIAALTGPDAGLSATGDEVVRLTAPFAFEVRPVDLMP